SSPRVRSLRAVSSQYSTIAALRWSPTVPWPPCGFWLEEGPPVIDMPPADDSPVGGLPFDPSLELPIGVEQDVPTRALVSEAARRRGCSSAIVSRSVRKQNASESHGRGIRCGINDKRSVDGHDVEASPHVEGTFHMRPVERDLRRCFGQSC